MSPLPKLVLSETRRLSCAKHGEYEGVYRLFSDDSEVPDTCQRCMEDRRVAEQEAAIERGRLYRIECLRKKSGIPCRFESSTFESFNASSRGQVAAVESIKKYEHDFNQHRSLGHCLILCGKPGTGKTHLATALCATLIERGFSACYRNTPGVLREIKDTWGRDSNKTEQDVLQSLWGVDLLVLDEVGVQFGSETEARLLFEIIDGRYRNLRPTVVVTNLNLEQLGKILGARSLDRLVERGSKVVVFDWGSYRQLPVERVPKTHVPITSPSL
jgi:DNA replication protein DnaC